ncbi:MAG: TSUP family transporter [Thiolinea sp.]
MSIAASTQRLMHNAAMSELTLTQLVLIGLCFIWSGFVRSGLGFGGAALTLPLLLLIVDDPLLFLPLIAVQLLVFSTLITWQSHRQAAQSRAAGTRNDGTIDWAYLRQSLWAILPTKLLGVFGLLTLPGPLVSVLIFIIVLVYALSYLIDKPFTSQHRWSDRLFLALGGYVSGTSLMGAPLMIAVYGSHVARHQLRETLFVLWMVLVVIKLGSFMLLGVDMQWQHQLWLLPCVTLGHFAGLRFHARLQQTRPIVFYRVLGSALLLISAIGLWRALV